MAAGPRADIRATAAPRIAVVGSFMQALCWRLDRLPLPGESAVASDFEAEAAGKGLAVAVACRRLGAAVDLLLSIGDDPAGDALMQRLRDERLPTRHVQRRAGRSGHGAGWLSADGANAIAVFVGANARLDAAQVALADEALTSATLVYAQLETPLEAAREAFARAREHGARTVLNASPWKTLDRALLACTQVLIVNEVEARQCLPQWPARVQPDDREPLRAVLQPLWDSWPGDAQRLLLVTLGDRGSLAFAPDGDSWFAAPFVRDARHSIGAGDAFAAGWCVCIARGESLATALRYGNACGAFAASNEGILDALPRAADIDAFVQPLP